MKPLIAIAIDDEPVALDVLESHVSKVPFIHLARTFLQPTEGLAYLQQQPVDLVFVDIQMPELLGTELVELHRNTQTAFIFVTAYPEYAVKGFELKALDYLLKPVSFSRFLEACNRAYQRVQQHKGQPKGIFVKDGYDWVKVDLAEVSYIQSDTNLLFIHQKGSKVSTRMTIGKMLELLPEKEFIRVHKSYIVALSKIVKLERHQLTVDGKTIPISNAYRETLEKQLLGG